MKSNTSLEGTKTSAISYHYKCFIVVYISYLSVYVQLLFFSEKGLTANVDFTNVKNDLFSNGFTLLIRSSLKR